MRTFSIIPFVEDNDMNRNGGNSSMTIDDVARLAGVSRATAGRAVGNYGNVSEKAREKVMRAVEELNYRPNAIAQGLRNQNTKTLAVIIGNIKNSYYNSLVFSIEDEAMKNGYNVLICNTNEQERKEIEHLQTVYSKRVDGIILTSVYPVDHLIPDHLRHLYDGDVPIVSVDRKINGMDIDLVQSDNEDASYRAAKYLISLGHRRIGLIGTKDYSTVRERIRGYRRALVESNIPIDYSIIVDAEYAQPNAGRMLTSKLLDQNNGITALYALNNTLCGGILLELKNRGMQVPRDISLLAWDDEELNQLFDITTISQPVEETGRMATRRLFDLIEHPEKRKEKQILQLKTEFICRKSCVKI